MTVNSGAMAAATKPVAAPIPFRQEAGSAAGDIGQVFLLLALLLGAFVAATALAWKKGWLARWGVPVSRPGALAQRDLRIEQALRLSARSSLYRVRDGDVSLLILESGGAAQVVRTTTHRGDEA